MWKTFYYSVSADWMWLSIWQHIDDEKIMFMSKEGRMVRSGD
jgi:hypothetical protein